METVVLARHGESRFGARALVNGEPDACEGLTGVGQEQARALGRELEATPLDLCVHTGFARTRETAELALEGRPLPTLVVPELGDIRAGRFERRPIEAYLSWAWVADPEEECPGGGESRAAAARRYVAGFRIVLARPERTALVVGHGLPIGYVRAALEGRDPPQRVPPVEHARPLPLSAQELSAAVDRLEAWCGAPAFA